MNSRSLNEAEDDQDSQRKWFPIQKPIFPTADCQNVYLHRLDLPLPQLKNVFSPASVVVVVVVGGGGAVVVVVVVGGVFVRFLGWLEHWVNLFSPGTAASGTNGRSNG